MHVEFRIEVAALACGGFDVLPNRFDPIAVDGVAGFKVHQAVEFFFC